MNFDKLIFIASQKKKRGKKEEMRIATNEIHEEGLQGILTNPAQLHCPVPVLQYTKRQHQCCNPL